MAPTKTTIIVGSSLLSLSVFFFIIYAAVPCDAIGDEGLYIQKDLFDEFKNCSDKCYGYKECESKCKKCQAKMVCGMVAFLFFMLAPWPLVPAIFQQQTNSNILTNIAKASVAITGLLSLLLWISYSALECPNTEGLIISADGVKGFRDALAMIPDCSNPFTEKICSQITKCRDKLACGICAFAFQWLMFPGLFYCAAQPTGPAAPGTAYAVGGAAAAPAGMPMGGMAMPQYPGAPQYPQGVNMVPVQSQMNPQFVTPPYPQPMNPPQYPQPMNPPQYPQPTNPPAGVGYK